MRSMRKESIYDCLAIDSHVELQSFGHFDKEKWKLPQMHRIRKRSSRRKVKERPISKTSMLMCVGGSDSKIFENHGMKSLVV